jgi:hypothetical protein
MAKKSEQPKPISWNIASSLSATSLMVRPAAKAKNHQR